MKMRVLITGAGGFIGQNVASFLIAQGFDVIGIYRNRRPAGVHKCIHMDLADKTQYELLKNEKIDVIIHFAGQMRGDKIKDYLDNTIGSARYLIEYAEQMHIKTFVYISSISVYGYTFSEVDETSDLIDLDDYGMTKYLCERMLEDADIEKKIVIRLPRVLGKGADLSYPWLPKVTAALMANEDVNYRNPNLMYNNVLYVDDFSAFIVHLLKQEMYGYELFVLGAQDKMRIIDILKTLKTLLMSDSKLIEQPASGCNTCYAINISHAQEYGFKSRQIREILGKFVEDITISMGEKTL